jgi:hypothetical protein
MNRKIKPERNSIKEKVYIFLILGGLLSVIYFIATSMRETEVKNIEFVKKDFNLTRGIITEKHTHKGNSIHIKYKVNGKVYEEVDGFNEKYEFKKGDSLTLKYSKSKPELMITEYNDKY